MTHRSHEVKSQMKFIISHCASYIFLLFSISLLILKTCTICKEATLDEITSFREAPSTKVLLHHWATGQTNPWLALAFSDSHKDDGWKWRITEPFQWRNNLITNIMLPSVLVLGQIWSTLASPTENSWMLHPLDKVSLCYFSSHQTIPSLNSDLIERSDSGLPTVAYFSASKRWSSGQACIRWRGANPINLVRA